MRHLFVIGLVSCALLAACNLPIPDDLPWYEEEAPTKTQEIIPTPEYETPLVTSTPVATISPTALSEQPQDTPTAVITQTPTATPFPLGVQLGSPQSLPNFAYPELGCQWMGVAGQIFKSDGTPLVDLVVEAGGIVGGQVVEGLAVTGSSVVYGPGSFEIKLADAPYQSSGAVWVQVLDLDGLPLSAPIYFQTEAECDVNLTLINFVESHTLPDEWIFLPLVNH